MELLICYYKLGNDIRIGSQVDSSMGTRTIIKSNQIIMGQ